jgi:glycerol-3-phosphate acyltransferase PlsX
MKIAVDAMGGDHAPERIVEGAVEAATMARDDLEVVLVGDQGILVDRFASLIHGLPVEISHAAETVAMDETPTAAVRRKRDSSIAVAMNLQHEGEVQAVVTAGNTGAAMASALVTLGRLPGVSRPAIATVLPTSDGASLLLDVGANTEVQPANLLEFGVMGSLYAEHVFQIKEPTVGLLSNGEESGKGTEVVVAANRLLSASSLNFIGNVQGRDILTGMANVVVCDGFTGNIILKFTEGIMSLLTAGLKRGLSRSPLSRVGALLMSPVFRQLRTELDYEEYGGAPLLGIDGVVVICHGGSTAKAIRNAVRVAGRMVQEGLNEHIKERMSSLHASEIQS